MRMTNQYYPVAIALTKQWGWQAIYEGFDFRGLTFEKVFWLREPTEELGVQVELCLRPNTKYPGGPNMLVPGIYDKIDEIELKFNAKRILKSFREGEE